MEEYKRYLVFKYDNYYPCGGIDDVYKSFDELDKAKEVCKNSKYDNSYVYDRIKGKVVFDKD